MSSDSTPIDPATNVQPTASPAERPRRTHLTDAITKIFKSLSLADRLKKNREIESRNHANATARLDFVLHPVEGQQEPPSETASFITLDEDLDWPTLENDALRTSLGWHLPLQVMRTDNLEQLIANRGGPAAVKKAPNSESKSILIYDLEALEKRFGRDDALTYSQWMDAVVHRAAFESLRDEQGPSGPYAVQIALLHDFFCNLRNAEESFQA
ncbi:hypothetical protein FISHEDRAFT_34493, partial [Fistulina hepatica ATCC 64428]